MRVERCIQLVIETNSLEPGVSGPSTTSSLPDQPTVCRATDPRGVAYKFDESIITSFSCLTGMYLDLGTNLVSRGMNFDPILETFSAKRSFEFACAVEEKYGVHDGGCG